MSIIYIYLLGTLEAVIYRTSSFRSVVGHGPFHDFFPRRSFSNLPVPVLLKFADLSGTALGLVQKSDFSGPTVRGATTEY